MLARQQEGSQGVWAAICAVGRDAHIGTSTASWPWPGRWGRSTRRRAELWSVFWQGASPPVCGGSRDSAPLTAAVEAISFTLRTQVSSGSDPWRPSGLWASLPAFWWPPIVPLRAPPVSAVDPCPFHDPCLAGPGIGIVSIPGRGGYARPSRVAAACLFGLEDESHSFTRGSCGNTSSFDGTLTGLGVPP